MSETDVRTQHWWQRLCRLALRLTGWQLEASLPPEPKYLIIGAFHTSNWDFPLALLAMGGMGLTPRWVGKDSLFRGVPGRLMKALGGIPVKRGAKRNFVRQMVDLYNRSDSLVVVMSPEGTRGKTTHWKTGFYYIALGANIPIALGYVDYRRKRVGVGGWFRPGGDLRADMHILRDFYRDKHGKYGAQHSDIRLLSDVPPGEQ